MRIIKKEPASLKEDFNLDGLDLKAKIEIFRRNSRMLKQISLSMATARIGTSFTTDISEIEDSGGMFRVFFLRGKGTFSFEFKEIKDIYSVTKDIIRIEFIKDKAVVLYFYL